ncbi:MAG TPA: hypothetical protein PLV51_12815 [Lentimicrobium sp.]|nr:hypothetical protein [Lentimicrobium sp.]
MTAFKHIARLLAVALVLLLTGASASAQSLTVFAGQTFTFSVDVQFAQEENITYEIYDNFTGINMAVVPGNCPLTSAFFPSGNTGSSVDITFLVPGMYMVKVEAVNDCPTNNMKFWLVEVLPALPTASLEVNPMEVCRGDTADLVITFTGDLPWSFELEINDGVNPPVTTTYTGISDNPYTIEILPMRTTTYRVLWVTDANGTNIDPSNSVTLTVKPRPDGGPIYQYDP